MRPKRNWRRWCPSALFGTTAPAVRVVLGMMVLLYCAIPLSITFGRKFMATELFPGLSNTVLAIVAVAGALGSIVSIMVRIQDFKGSVIGGRGSVLFFTGFFKPIIGAGFALFVFAALSAKFIPRTVESARETYVFAALAFVAGFSERFASDLVSKTAQSFNGARSPRRG